MDLFSFRTCTNLSLNPSSPLDSTILPSGVTQSISRDEAGFNPLNVVDTNSLDSKEQTSAKVAESDGASPIPKTLRAFSSSGSPNPLHLETRSSFLAARGFSQGSSSLGGPSASSFYPRSPAPSPVSPVTSATHIITSKARSISIQSSGPPLRFFSMGDDEVDEGKETKAGVSEASPASTLTAKPLSVGVSVFGDGTGVVVPRESSAVPITSPATELTLAHAKSGSFFPRSNLDSPSISPTTVKGAEGFLNLKGRDQDSNTIRTPSTSPLQASRPRVSPSLSFNGPYATPTAAQLQHELTQNEIACSNLSLDPKLVEFCSSLKIDPTSSQSRQVTRVDNEQEIEMEIEHYTEQIRRLQFSQAKLHGVQAERQRVSSPTTSIGQAQSSSSPSSPISELSSSSQLYGGGFDSHNPHLTLQQQLHLADSKGEEHQQALWNAKMMQDGFEGLVNGGSSIGGPSPSNRKASLYKTERCRSWEESGKCRYGAKCQFAHGGELRPVQRHPKVSLRWIRLCQVKTRSLIHCFTR